MCIFRKAVFIETFVQLNDMAKLSLVIIFYDNSAHPDHLALNLYCFSSAVVFIVMNKVLKLNIL